ncbi:hypothetical protein [Pseudoalteromonas sp. MMG013]|nr:hypothetical protein [Pseudoalteromonas sp. MMG013]
MHIDQASTLKHVQGDEVLIMPIKHSLHRQDIDDADKILMTLTGY